MEQIKVLKVSDDWSDNDRMFSYGENVYTNLTEYGFIKAIVNGGRKPKTTLAELIANSDEVLTDEKASETLTKKVAEILANIKAGKHRYFILTDWRCGVGMDEAKFREVWLTDSEVKTDGNYKYDKDGNELLTEEQKWAKEDYLLCD